MSKNKQHRPPSSSTNLQVSKAPTKSVGLPAIMESMKQMGRWMDMPKAFKASLKMNQKDGFDCPGCAWPDPNDERSSVGEYCENGIKALAEEATNKKADPRFFAQYSVQELSEMSDYQLGKSGRITDPMYLAPGATHYKKISWDNAMQKMANQLKELDDPDEAIFYTSGRTSNEAAFMYGTFIRAFGTNNLPDCSNMCHESSGYALSKTQGIGKGSVVLSDIYEADLVIIMGQNPGTNHPRMLSALEKNKVNGGTIVAVNPLKEAGLLHYTNPQKPFRMLTGGLVLTDLYLQVNINGDLALLKAILFKLQQREEAGESIWDRAFIDEHTEGYDELKAEIQATDLEACIKECGIDSDKIDELVELFFFLSFFLFVVVVLLSFFIYFFRWFCHLSLVFLFFTNSIQPNKPVFLKSPIDGCIFFSFSTSDSMYKPISAALLTRFSFSIMRIFSIAAAHKVG